MVSATDFVVFCDDEILYLYGESSTYDLLEIEKDYKGNGVMELKNDSLILLVVNEN